MGLYQKREKDICYGFIISLKNLEKLYIDVHHAKKAIPHKKKELIQIEKHYKELHKLVDIIVGSVVDM